MYKARAECFSATSQRSDGMFVTGTALLTSSTAQSAASGRVVDKGNNAYSEATRPRLLHDRVHAVLWSSISAKQ